MTTRQAFEEWVKKNHPFGNLVGKADAREMFPDYWSTWQAATAAERERCAKVCDESSQDAYARYRASRREYDDGQCDVANELADKIRGVE